MDIAMFDIHCMLKVAKTTFVACFENFMAVYRSEILSVLFTLLKSLRSSIIKSMHVFSFENLHTMHACIVF